MDFLLFVLHLEFEDLGTLKFEQDLMFDALQSHLCFYMMVELLGLVPQVNSLN